MVRAVCALSVAVAAYAGLYRVRTFDTFFHLSAGRHLALHGAPSGDPFSFTFPGAPWQNHSQAFERALFWLYDHFGFAGLSVAQAACAAGLVALALRGAVDAGRSELAAASLAALPAAAFREQLCARPHLVGMLGLAALLVLAQRALRTRRGPVLWLAPPVYAAWATSHGSHLLAFFILGVLCVVAVGRAERALCRHVLAVTAVCALLLLWLAPHAVTQGTEHLTSEFLRDNVSEWYPLTLADVLGTWPGRALGLCATTAVAGAFWLVREKSPLAGLIVPLLSGLLALAATSHRMAAVFLLGASPLWLPLSALCLERAAARLSRRLHAALAVLALGATLAATAAQGATFRAGAGLAHERVPAAAVRYLKERARRARVYNAYNFGGYLMLAGLPVFVDGRALTLYPAWFLRQFEAVYDDPRGFDALSRRYSVDAVLLPARSPRSGRLVAYLEAHPSWRGTYADEVAVVFEPAQQAR